MSEITFVTALYELGRKKDEYSLNRYIQLFNNLLSLPLKFIVYTTSEIRARLTPNENTFFVLDEPIPYIDKLPEISESWSRNYRTTNLDKDTAIFGCLTHGKFYWLNDSINKYCKTKNIAWIDAGIIKAAFNVELLPTLNATNKIKMMALNYASRAEIQDPGFVYECRYKVAAGFFVGPMELMRIFCQKIMSFKIEGLEQEYMTIVLYNNRYLFDLYYGDFCDLFRNYNKVVYNRHLLERAILNATIHQDNEEVERLKLLL